MSRFRMDNIPDWVCIPCEFDSHAGRPLFFCTLKFNYILKSIIIKFEPFTATDTFSLGSGAISFY